MSAISKGFVDMLDNVFASVQSTPIHFNADFNFLPKQNTTVRWTKGFVDL
jgi:hypothetical protein